MSCLTKWEIEKENLNRTMDSQNEVTENEAMENEALANEATPAFSVEPSSKKKFESKEKWWRVDKEMVGFKLHFFLLTGALGSVLPFIAVIVKDRLKLSATSFATVLMFEQFFFIFTKPTIGYITDYFNKLKAVLCIVAIGQAIFLFLLLLLPPLPKEPTAIDNATFIDLEVNIPDVCTSCASFQGIKKELKISLNFTEDSHLNDSSHQSLGKVCDVLKTQIVEAKQTYDKVIVPSECRTSNNYTSSRNKSVKFSSTDTKNYTILNPKSFYACSQAPDDACSFFVHNCIVCCNEKTSCHYFLPTVHMKTPQEVSSVLTDFEFYQFWLFVLVFVLLNACINAIFTLSDTACCESVVKNGADYGKQRLWGAIGWGLFAPVGGLLRDYTGDYISTWIVFAAMSTLMLWNIWRLNLVKPHFSKDILKNITTIMKSNEFLCFEVGVFVNGIGLGFIWFYLMWFLTSIGGNRLVCGLAHTVQCFVGELPFMFFSGWMLKKMGYFNILTLSLLAYCIRFFWYSQLENPWYVLPIEWTHGITYGVFYTSIATYAKMSAKPGTETTTQAVIFATYDGLGSGIGNIVAGLGFDYLGPQMTFFYTGVFFGCCSLISMCFTLFRRKRTGAEDN
ncbi:major facilitator superfamily domain-containing protein 6 [Trichonephila clavata]|uniref:Major facilitator superfamily domain-containing protein 6 n=1 Tax=Trichonephila clavata TaxID=2740835 RepID=A0A8X6G2J8_TRICU|nr:major facilitator superfamily domain-containing protein 6 [Trichonephila clavata]